LSISRWLLSECGGESLGSSYAHVGEGGADVSRNPDMDGDPRTSYTRRPEGMCTCERLLEASGQRVSWRAPALALDDPPERLTRGQSAGGRFRPEPLAPACRVPGPVSLGRLGEEEASAVFRHQLRRCWRPWTGAWGFSSGRALQCIMLSSGSHRSDRRVPGLWPRQGQRRAGRAFRCGLGNHQ